MNKVLKCILIIFPIIFTIILVINISFYYVNLNNNQNIIEKKNNYQEKIDSNSEKNKELLIKLNEKKEDNKDKNWEYERWEKWNQEIKEKIN